MMNRLMLVLAGIALYLAANRGAAEVVVVVSSEADLKSLDRNTLENIYLGRPARLPDGTNAVPLDLPEGSAQRIEFYAELLNRSEAQIKAHWARLIFTGRGRPPRILANSEALLDWLHRNPGSIGYLDRSLVDERVRVVYSPATGSEAPTSVRSLPTTSGASET
ncbi:MAG: phosphate ABC transporter substrate-binding protein [Pseudohongiellaceae bacterium]